MKTETRLNHLEDEHRLLREQIRTSVEMLQNSERLVDFIVDDPKMKDTIEKISKSSVNPDVLLDIDRCNRKISALKDELTLLQNQVGELRTRRAQPPAPSPVAPVAPVAPSESPQVVIDIYSQSREYNESNLKLRLLL